MQLFALIRTIYRFRKIIAMITMAESAYRTYKKADQHRTKASK